MTEPPFRWPLKDNEIRVIDGDTVEVKADRGWKDTKVVSVRILGTDAPESNTRQNLLERQAGKLVTRVVQLWVDRWLTEGVQFFASSEDRPKYANRVIGRLWADSLERPGAELSAFLLVGGFARPYQGGKRPEWSDQDLDAIIKRCRAYLAPSENSQESLDPEGGTS